MEEYAREPWYVCFLDVCSIDLQYSCIDQCIIVADLAQKLCLDFLIMECIMYLIFSYFSIMPPLAMIRMLYFTKCLVSKSSIQHVNLSDPLRQQCCNNDLIKLPIGNQASQFRCMMSEILGLVEIQAQIRPFKMPHSPSA